LAIGLRGKGVKQIRVKRNLGCSPPIVKSVGYMHGYNDKAVG